MLDLRVDVLRICVLSKDTAKKPGRGCRDSKQMNDMAFSFVIGTRRPADTKSSILKERSIERSNKNLNAAGVIVGDIFVWDRGGVCDQFEQLEAGVSDE